MTQQSYPQIPDVLTLSELQQFLNIGRSTAYRLVCSGEIKSVRIGRAIRIPKGYVIDYLENNTLSVEKLEKTGYNHSRIEAYCPATGKE